MARKRPPTDELRTEIYDSRRPQTTARPKSPTKKGFESGEITLRDRETLDDRATLEVATPTEIDAPRKERSEPIRVISMKAPGEFTADRKQHDAHNLKPEIRQLSDVLPRNATPPRGMGRLAPPVDHKQRRSRKLRDWLIWGSVLVIITCVVMLGVWFLARR